MSTSTLDMEQVKTGVWLYAPAAFVQATPEVRALVVNGCGPGGWKVDLVPDRIWGLDIRIVCDIHDWMYATGETIADKEAADRTMLNNMLRMIDAAGGPWWLVKLRRIRAREYYEAISHFGGPAFWAGKNPGTELYHVTIGEVA
jgi:hypothetical protein